MKIKIKIRNAVSARMGAAAPQMDVKRAKMTAFVRRVQYAIDKDLQKLPELMCSPLIPALDAAHAQGFLQHLISGHAHQPLRTILRRGLLEKMDNRARLDLLHFAMHRGTDRAFCALLAAGALDLSRNGVRAAVRMCVRCRRPQKLVHVAMMYPSARTSLFDGDSLLAIAVARYSDDLVELLLDAGCDVNGVCGQKKAPIMCAISAGLNVTLLLESGADVMSAQPTGADSEPMTPLRYILRDARALHFLHTAAHEFIRAGANVFQCGRTPCVCTADDLKLGHEPTRVAIRETIVRMRQRVVETALGLCALGLPVLCVVGVSEWLMPADRGEPLRMHQRWQIASAVQRHAYAAASGALETQE